MHALARGLTGLGISGKNDLMLEGLHEAFVLVAFLEDVADGGFGEVTGGDEALALSVDAEIGGNRHDMLLVLMLRVDVCAWQGNIRAV
jgi:hypothetical protein